MTTRDSARDPDFFKLHYRQWRRRMHKLRVPFDLQGALLCIVIETHLAGAPPADDAYVLAGVFMVTPKRARGIADKLCKLGLVRSDGGFLINETAISDAEERRRLREIRAASGREGGIMSGISRRHPVGIDNRKVTLEQVNPLKENETGESLASGLVELEKRREEKIKETTPIGVAKKERNARGSRLPPDWSLPADWRAWSAEFGMPETMIGIEADAFRDFWISKPGQGGAKLDWMATWRNWCRRSMERKPQRTNGGSDGKSREEQSWQRELEIARALDRRDAADEGLDFG